ncbi:MAG TPA: alpha/beta fold hydrolase [Myxococcales bacterium]
MAASLAGKIGRKVLIVLGSVALGWILAMVVVSTQQVRIIFPAPPGNGHAPGRGKVLRLPSPAGEIAAVHFEGPPGSRTAIFFHGNGEEMVDGEDWAVELQRAGLGVLLVEYPGYGLTKSLGPPSEEKCYLAAETALTYLRETLGVPVERTILSGHSLGSAVAAEMALRGRGARLVLLSPLSSTADVGKDWLWYLPVDLLVRHRFETLKKAPRIHVPTLVVHGKRDQVAPVWMGERIAKALPNVQLVVLESANHDLIWPRLNPLAVCVAAFADGKACELR